jgi:uncharacterized protein YciI
MTKSTRFVFAVTALAVVAAIVYAQSTSQSNSQSQTGRGSATASSSASGSARGGGSLNGFANVGPWRDLSKQVYALVYAPGPAWERNKGVFEQRLQDHNQYMGDLFRANVLLLGGPFTDSSGWLAVIQVSGEDQAMIIAADDPAVKSRLMNVVVRPWTLMFERNGASGVSTGGFGSPTVGTAGGAVKTGGG